MKKKFIPTILFAVFIFGLFFADLIIPDQEFSDMENRYLTKFSAPTKKSIIEGKFMTDYETYVNDQFVLRSQWITLKSVGESALLKTENNGIVYGKDNFMFDKTIIETGEGSRFESNLNYIIEFAQENPKENIYFSLVPSSASVYKDKLPYGIDMEEQQTATFDAYNKIDSDKIVYIDLNPPSGVSDDLYYKTDHHWTTTGAYRAYRIFTEASGGVPIELETLNSNTVENFYGAYYSKCKLFSAEPDTITYYDVPVNSVIIDGKEKKGLYDLEQFKERDKYAGLIYGNNGLTVINSEVKNGKNLLVVKDSYGASLVPFSTQNYENIYMVDLRYYKDTPELLKKVDFDDIYIIYYVINFSTDGNVINLLD